MGDAGDFEMRERDLIRLLASWGKASRPGLVEMVLLGQATALIARESVGLSEAEFTTLMREAFSDG